MDGERPFGGVWQLTYVDGQGRITRREVEARALLAGDGDCDLIAFCKLRQGERTFRVSRIASMVEAGTGRALEELGGVRLVSLEARAARAAEVFLQSDAQFLADVLAVLARGPVSLAAVRAMLAFLPPDEYAGEIAPEAMATVLAGRYGELGIDNDLDVEFVFRSGFMPWREAPKETRLALGRLVGDAVQTSPWPEDTCVRLIEVMAEELSLDIRVRKR